jgi:hypothetical protein
MSDNPLIPDALDRYRQQQLNPLLQAASPSGSMFDRSPDTAAGLVPGNINIHQRPVVKNADGSISVRSMTFTDDDGRAVLIPTVLPGRGVVPPQQAIDHYYKTGEHLGIFEHPDLADAYARALHEQQATEYQR